LPSPDSIAEALHALGLPQGEGVHLVGGTVRDILLGREGFDVDIAVEGDAIAFAEGLGGEVTAHGRFGTAVVRFEDGRHWDVVTARRETYSAPAALPDVEAGTIADDLARRDFTVNAIAASLEPGDYGRILDPHRGRADLDARVIRILHPRSFVDDPTRIFRAIRYENRLGFRMDPETERLAREGREGIALLSNARFREEVVALLSEGGIAHTLERLAELAGISADTGLVERVDTLRDELDPGAPRWRLRLAVLAREHPGLVERLSLRREDQRAVEDAVALAPRLAEAHDVVEISDLAGRSPDAALLALALRDTPALRDWFTRLRDVRLELGGDDLAGLGLPESPRVGEVLEELRRRKLRGELDGREAELEAARELIADE
jgi:tRNA nucleotidyltransferase (CCA-adding enzyme)